MLFLEFKSKELNAQINYGDNSFTVRLSYPKSLFNHSTHFIIDLAFRKFEFLHTNELNN